MNHIFDNIIPETRVCRTYTLLVANKQLGKLCMANSYDVSKSYILTSWLCMQWPTVESISDGYLVPCWQLSLDSQQERVFPNCLNITHGK